MERHWYILKYFWSAEENRQLEEGPKKKCQQASSHPEQFDHAKNIYIYKKYLQAT